jgi:hypothetical protein
MRDPTRNRKHRLILAEIVAYYGVLFTWMVAAAIVSRG